MQLRRSARATHCSALRRLGAAPRPWLATICFLLTCAASASAHAECDSQADISPCVPATTHWARSGASRWSALPDVRLLNPFAASYSLTAEYQYKPLSLVAPSPDPDGREIQLVRHRLTTTLGARLAVTSRLELGLSLPVIVAQNGAGTRGVTDRTADSIPARAVGDPRLESRYRLLAAPRAGSLDAGITLAFPLGNDDAHTSEPSVVAAPELLWLLDLGRVSFGVGASGRLRRTVSLGTASYGSQLGLTLAADVVVLERWLGVGMETWALTGLAVKETVNGAEGRTKHVERPAEWLLSVRSSPLPGFQLSLGGGSAIPISTETTASGTQYSSGLGTGPLRVLLGIQYRAE